MLRNFFAPLVFPFPPQLYQVIPLPVDFILFSIKSGIVGFVATPTDFEINYRPQNSQSDGNVRRD